MKNLIQLSTLIWVLNFGYAQIGIGTEFPQSSLDINGDMTIRDKIYAGGSDHMIGNPGARGQVLVSGGLSKPPMWKTLNIPIINPGDYYLIYTNAFFDDAGIVFSNNTSSGNVLYQKGTDFSTLSGWKTIDGLTQPFEVYSDTNKIYITYEAVVQLEGSGVNTGVDFACGIFLDNKLQGVRTSSAKRASSSDAFMTFLMVIIADQLTAGIHQTKVACTRKQNIGNYTGDFSVGTNVGSNINEFVAQSSLKIEVYEVPENFISVVE